MTDRRSRQPVPAAAPFGLPDTAAVRTADVPLNIVAHLPPVPTTGEQPAVRLGPAPVAVDPPVAAPPVSAPHRESLPAGLLRAMRPRQWVKNVLVLAVPFAAGAVTELDVVVDALVALVLFCTVASAVYLLNDAVDVEEDRRHPRKRFRPIASGVVPRGLAVGLAVVLFVVALAVATLVTRPALAWVLTVYVVVQVAYCLWLKQQPVIDLAVVSSGFLLRAVAGGAAAGIPVSQWFLLVAAFGSLFMVAGKRYSELVVVGEGAATRRSLQQYSASYLRFVWGMSAGVTVTVYSLWAFQMGQGEPGVPWSQISIAPFVLGLLRHAVDLDRGAAGEPEQVVLHDCGLLLIGLVWLVTVGLGAVAR